ncbi:MAG: hypothetical protein WD266_08665 [Balneolales bacterium]
MKSQFYKIISLALITVLAITGLSVYANEAETEDLSDFLIIVNTTDEEIMLKCVQGCAWKKLRFSSSLGNSYQAVDQYGMTNEAGKVFKEKSDQLEFMFKIRKTENGVSFKGKKGTAWKALSFSCLASCDQAVNQYGMTHLDSN